MARCMAAWPVLSSMSPWNECVPADYMADYRTMLNAMRRGTTGENREGEVPFASVDVIMFHVVAFLPDSIVRLVLKAHEAASESCEKTGWGAKNHSLLPARE